MKKFFENFSLMGVLMLVLCAVLGVGDMSGAIVANGTATGITGGATATDAGGVFISQEGKGGALETSDIRAYRPEMIQDPVDQNLVKIRPTLAPLDTIMRYGKVMSTTSFEFKWYSIGTRPVDDTIATAIGTPASNADPHLVQETITLTGTVNNYAVSDTILLPTITGADGKELVAYVVSKNPVSNTLTVAVADEQLTFAGGTYTFPTVKGSEPIYRLGRAAAELDVTTDAVSYIPKPSRGYCQRFMFEVAQSTYEAMMKKEINFSLTEVEEQAMYEYRKSVEASMLFGRMGKIWDPVKQSEVYLTGGIANQISNNYTITVSGGTAALVTLMKDIFTGNSGAKERIVFAGSNFVEKFSTLDTVQKQLEAGNTEVIWGISWKKVESNFGTLLLVHHELLDEYGWSDKAIVIDPQYLKKWQVSNFERKEYDGKELAIMNGKFVVCSEACGVALYNPDAHAIVTAV